MEARERILAVLDRRPVDRPPVDLWTTPEVAAQLREALGASNDFEVYRRLGVDKIVWVFPELKSEGGQRFGTQAGAGAECGGRRTMWGVPLIEVRAGPATYMEFGGAPLQEYSDVAALEDYPWWPDPGDIDYESALALARQARDEGFAVIGPWVSLFEIYCQLRGLETALCDLMECPEYVDAVLDRVEVIQTEILRRWFRMSEGLVDMVFVSDDVAGQHGLLLSPDMWRRHLQPRLERWCRLIHDHGLRVFYHTDGAARPLLEPIVDCGVDVLNPIQHACPGMDLEELARALGPRVIFHGGIDNQQVLSRGTPDDVRKETRRCLATLGREGGYIVCSCHNVQPGTPLENIWAMVETVHEWRS